MTVNNETPDDRFDRRMMERMKAAKSLGHWIELRNILLRASSHDNLRLNIRLAFNLEAPSTVLRLPGPASESPTKPYKKKRDKQRRQEPTVAAPRQKGPPVLTVVPTDPKPILSVLKQGTRGRASGFVGLSSLQEAYEVQT